MTRLGKFELHTQLGRGGMGVVYQAWDPTMRRWVALKMIAPDVASRELFTQCFKQEAISAAQLSGHRNIVTIYETGEQKLLRDDGTSEDVCFIAMEFIAGYNLDQILVTTEWRQSVTLAEKLVILIQIAQGLSYAHTKGVVHRDLKPANIMIARDGGAKIVDFGIARLGESTARPFTMAGAGTPQYSAPEQLEGLTADGRIDIFALGVIAYRMFTGHLPFESDNVAATLKKILNDPYPPMSNYLVDYPPELDRILGLALAKDREERYQSVGQLVVDLQLLLATLNAEVIPHRLAEAEVQLDALALPQAREALSKILRQQPHNARALEMWQLLLSLENLDPASTGVGPEINFVLPAVTVDTTPPPVQEIPAPRPSNTPAPAFSQSAESITDVMQEHVGQPSAFAAYGGNDLNAGTGLPGPPGPAASSVRAKSVVAQQSIGGSAQPTNLFFRRAATAVAAVIAIGLVAFFGLHSRQTPVAVPQATLQLDVIPWAEVKEVRGVDSKPVSLPDSLITPVRFKLPAGEYELLLNHPSLGSMTVPVHLQANQVARVHQVYAGFNPEEAVSTQLKLLSNVTAPRR